MLVASEQGFHSPEPVVAKASMDIVSVGLENETTNNNNSESHLHRTPMKVLSPRSENLLCSHSSHLLLNMCIRVSLGTHRQCHVEWTRGAWVAKVAIGLKGFIGSIGLILYSKFF